MSERRRKMGKLSHELIDLGFFSALGTSEHPGFCREGQHVRRGTPNTYDSNNGVSVVFDEEGRPWIVVNRNMNDETAPKLTEILHEYGVKRGAYVPHSNDGGHFVLSIMSKL